jgi:hypothetical protein
VGSPAWLATQLDARMVAKRIAPSGTRVEDLPVRPGTKVAGELGGRPLLRYVDYAAVHENQRTTMTFVCPTPYAPADQVEYLALPRPDLVRDFVIMLDPAAITEIAGPKWCDLGQGIEYVLLNGYPPQAVLAPGWAVKIR